MKSTLNIKSIASVAAVITMLFGAASPIFAANPPTGLTMSPVNYTGNFRPGELVKTSFTLTNNNADPISIQLSAVELNGDKTVDANSVVAGWTTLDQTQVTLAPTQKFTENVTIAIPANATTGAYYPAILAQINGATKSGSGTSINSDLAFQMGINVTAELPKTSVQVTKLTADSVVLTGQVNISYEITNSLTMFIKPISYLQILDPQGHPVYSQTLNEDLQILKSGQKLTGTVTASLPMTVQSIGQYRVELLVLDKQFSGADIMKTNFVVLPIWIPVGILAGVILLAFAAKTMMKNRKASK